jgi:hypothetical protein
MEKTKNKRIQQNFKNLYLPFLTLLEGNIIFIKLSLKI